MSTRMSPPIPASSPALSDDLPRVGDTVSWVRTFSLDGQRAVVELQGEGLGRGLGEAAADLTLAPERA